MAARRYVTAAERQLALWCRWSMLTICEIREMSRCGTYLLSCIVEDHCHWPRMHGDALTIFAFELLRVIDFKIDLRADSITVELPNGVPRREL